MRVIRVPVLCFRTCFWRTTSISIGHSNQGLGTPSWDNGTYLPQEASAGMSTLHGTNTERARALILCVKGRSRCQCCRLLFVART